MTKRRIIIVVAVVMVLALSPFIFLFGINSYHSARERLRRIPFESTSWQDPKQVDGQDPVRIRMVDELVRSRRLDHQSRAEVEKLLGKPTSTEYFKEYDFVYWIGPERGFISIDSEWLVISLDRNGIVHEYKVIRD